MCGQRFRFSGAWTGAVAKGAALWEGVLCCDPLLPGCSGSGMCNVMELCKKWLNGGRPEAVNVDGQTFRRCTGVFPGFPDEECLVYLLGCRGSPKP